MSQNIIGSQAFTVIANIVGVEQTQAGLNKVSKAADTTSRQVRGGARSQRRFTQFLLEGSRAAEDATIVYGTQGLAGSIRASLNNMSQMGTILGPLAGALVGFTGAAVTIFLPQFVKLAESIFNTNKALFEHQEAIIKARAEASKGIFEGLDSFSSDAVSDALESVTEQFDRITRNTEAAREAVGRLSKEITKLHEGKPGLGPLGSLFSDISEIRTANKEIESRFTQIRGLEIAIARGEVRAPLLQQAQTSLQGLSAFPNRSNIARQIGLDRLLEEGITAEQQDKELNRRKESIDVLNEFIFQQENATNVLKEAFTNLRQVMPSSELKSFVAEIKKQESVLKKALDERAQVENEFAKIIKAGVVDEQNRQKVTLGKPFDAVSEQLQLLRLRQQLLQLNVRPSPEKRFVGAVDSRSVQGVSEILRARTADEQKGNNTEKEIRDINKQIRDLTRQQLEEQIKDKTAIIDSFGF